MYLEQRGIRTKPSGKLPPCADVAQVSAYLLNETTGPCLETLQMDWVAPFSGHWNQAILDLVAEALLKNIREGCYEPQVAQDIFISHAEIRKMCEISLISTRKRFLASIPRDSEDTEMATDRARQRRSQTNSTGRRLKRRYGVRFSCLHGHVHN